MEYLSIFVLSQSLVAVIKSHVHRKKKRLYPLSNQDGSKKRIWKVAASEYFLVFAKLCCRRHFILKNTSIIDITVLGITDGTTYKRIGMKKW